MADSIERKPQHGTLRQYVGIGMAAMMVGRTPEQTGIIYDTINEYDIPVYKVGGVSLISFDDLVVTLGHRLTPPDAEPLWPQEVGDLPVRDLYSRTELAALLNVSVGTIHRRAAEGKIIALDLSEWNMHSMYYYDGPTVEQLPVETRIGGRRVRLSVIDGELHIDVWTEGPTHAICFNLEPNKAWFVENYTNETDVFVRVHNKESL